MSRSIAISFLERVAAPLCLLAVGAVAAWGQHWPVAALAVVGGALAGLISLVARRRSAAERTAEHWAAAGAAARARTAERAAADLERLFQSIEEPLVATDSSGAVVLWNRAAEGLLGVAAPRAIGRQVEEVFTQQELIRIHAAAREGRGVREQVPIARADGPRVWEVAAAPLGSPGVTREEGESGIFAAVMEIRDVTEQARSLQVKTDFVANASHELRTPIAAMRMALETLGGLGEEDQPMRARLHSMLSGSVTRMEEMVRDLLDLSRLESSEAALRIEPAPASDLARALSNDFAIACRERDLRLTFDMEPALERLRTDGKLLGLILANLIDNATKFAFEGTEIRVVGRVSPGENGGAGGARIDVVDRGVGIPLNQQARIFERYYQVDAARDGGRARRGTGLGLAIVKHAVRRLGGTVKVHSVWQQGTTMTVEIPGCVPAG